MNWDLKKKSNKGYQCLVITGTIPFTKNLQFDFSILILTEVQWNTFLTFWYLEFVAELNFKQEKENQIIRNACFMILDFQHISFLPQDR